MQGKVIDWVRNAVYDFCNFTDNFLILHLCLRSERLPVRFPLKLLLKHKSNCSGKGKVWKSVLGSALISVVYIIFVVIDQGDENCDWCGAQLEQKRKDLHQERSVALECTSEI